MVVLPCPDPGAATTNRGTSGTRAPSPGRPCRGSRCSHSPVAPPRPRPRPPPPASTANPCISACIRARFPANPCISAPIRAGLGRNPAHKCRSAVGDGGSERAGARAVALRNVNAADLLDVVGIGADGWRGLPEDARAAIRDAEVLLGSTRQLALLPADVPGRRVAWPSPLLPALQPLLDEHAGRRVCVLASGDPMFHGIGATLARVVGAGRLRVHTHPSSASLACARLGWPAQDVVVVNLLSQQPDVLAAQLFPGRRVLVLIPSASAVLDVCKVLRHNGFAPSTVVVLC